MGLARASFEIFVPPVAVVELEHHQPFVWAKITVFNEVHPSNACQPIVVTESGIAIVESEVQPRNAPPPIVVTVPGIVIAESETHPRNAS